MKVRLQLTDDVLAKLEQAYDDVLEAFGSSLGLRNAEAEGLSHRVTAFALSIGKRVPIPKQFLAGSGSRRLSS